MAALSASAGFTPVEHPAVAVAADGRLASVHEVDRVTILELPSVAAVAEVGVDPDAQGSEIGWIGTPGRLLVLSRYEAHSTVHLLDPHGPRSIAEVRLEAPMRLYASVDGVALVIGALGAAVIAATETHLTLYPFPSRVVPVTAGAAGSQFVIALPASIEAWDPRTRMPTKRMRLPRAAAITSVGGSDRLVWMTTQQEPQRIDVIPLINRGQPRAHELPEPIARIAGHPRSDMLAVVGESGKLYAVDLDGRQPMRRVALDDIDRVEAAALLGGRAAMVVLAQAQRPVVLVALDARNGDPTVAVSAPRGQVIELTTIEPARTERSVVEEPDDEVIEAHAGSDGAEPAEQPSEDEMASAEPADVELAEREPDEDDRPRSALFDEEPIDHDLGPSNDEPGSRGDEADDPDDDGGRVVPAPEPIAEGAPRSGPLAALRALRDRSAAVARPAEPAPLASLRPAVAAPPRPAPSGPAAAPATPRPAIARPPGFMPRAARPASEDAAKPASSASERFSAWRDQVRQSQPRDAADEPATPPIAAREQPARPTAARAPAAPPIAAREQPARPTAARAPAAPPIAAREAAPRPTRGAFAQARGQDARASAPSPATSSATAPAAAPARPPSARMPPPALSLEPAASPVVLSWRDELVGWTRGVLTGLPTTPISAPPIEALIERLDLAPTIQPVLALLYGAHLYGERGVAPVDVARVLGRNWDEALGRGELAQHALAVFAHSRVTLAPVVQRMLDELAPHTGVLIGDMGPVALLGPCVAIGAADEPLGAVAFRCLPAVAGAILAAHDGVDRGQLAFEARIYGAVAMRRITDADAVTNELTIFVVEREELADQLPLPRIA